MAAVDVDTSANPGKTGLSRVKALILLVLCLAAYLPGIAYLPPTDRDESRFVQATRQMVETHNYVDIRFQDKPRYKKPIGIYWLQAAAVDLSGRGANAPIWVYRLVSVLGATLAVLAIAWLGARLFGDSAGFMAGITLGSVLLLGVEGRIAKTDATLLATVVFAQAALATLWMAARERKPSGWAPALVFWIATGAGILIKGPVAPFVSLLTILALSFYFRDWRWIGRLKPLTGLIIVLAIAMPWLVAITVKSGGAFWSQSVGHDFLGKIGSGQESHGAPPGYYALLFPATIWPFGVFAIRGALATLGRWRTDPRLAFLAAWYLPYWLVIELVPTKLPHYILPAYPAMILALAWALQEGLVAMPPKVRWRIWLERLVLLGSALGSLVLAGLAVGVPLWLEGSVSIAGVVAAVAALAAGALTSGRVLSDRPRIATGAAAFCAIATYGLVTTFVLPAQTRLWTSVEIANALRAHRPCPHSGLASAGYAEPSLVFLTRTSTLLTNGAGAAEFLESNPACAVAVVTQKQEASFFAKLPDGRASVTPLASLSALNYSNGRELQMTLYRMVGTAQPTPAMTEPPKD